VLYAAVAFPWIYGVAITLPFTMPTTGISGGHCRFQGYWPSLAFSTIYSLSAFLMHYCIPLGVFAFCYTKIIWTVRGSLQLRNPANRVGDVTTASDTTNQSNVISSQQVRVRVGVISKAFLSFKLFAMVFFKVVSSQQEDGKFV